MNPAASVHVEHLREVRLAEGVGFEPTKDVTALTRLAGGRTRPLCDPSDGLILRVPARRRQGIDSVPNALCGVPWSGVT